MAHVTLVWELGAGFGHLVKLRLLAEAYLGLGQRVSLISAHLDSAARIFADLQVRLLQAPRLPRPAGRFALSPNYAANLLRNGYLDVPALAQAMAAWDHCFSALKPDLVAVEHAPTALLALRGSALPRMVIGTGFSLPPDCDPMPSLQPWLPLPAAHLVEREQVWLAHVNAALDKRACPPVRAVRELFAGCQRWVCGFPELDYYQERGAEQWSGPLVTEVFPLQSRESLPWSDRRPVFVSLERGQAVVEPVLRALVEGGTHALVYLRGGEAGDVPVRADCLHFLERPVDLAEVVRHCRAALCPGGFGTVWSLLRHGMPLLICPGQLEQGLLGYRLQQRGLAQSLSLFTRQQDISARVHDFLAASTPAPALQARLPAWKTHRSALAARRVAESSLAALAA